MSNLPLLSFLAAFIQAPWSLWPTTTTTTEACARLTSLTLENTTILSASYVPVGTNITLPEDCGTATSMNTAADVCRVYGIVNTTADSAVEFEIWLPDTWYGRFLTVGNGGLGGCINHDNIDYGASLHFATIGTDNGHHGMTGESFLHSPEVIHDFAHRAIHTGAVIGKQITQAYYHRVPSRSYYIGCSTGGRQGIQSALLHPDDFEGIVAGAPAIDFNHLIGWEGMIGRYIGAPHPESSPSFIPLSSWPLVSQEILKQCDGLDGKLDGFIAEPDDCNFDPTVLLCAAGSTENCLTRPQIDALNNIFRPLYDTQGQLIYPRLDPGAESDLFAPMIFGGEISRKTQDWMKYAIHHDPELSFDNFSVKDVEYMHSVNPGGIATWNGDLSAFRNRGGKLLTYHGRRDPLITSGNSKRYHKLVSSTLSTPIDDFYRLFLVPGVDHCGYSAPGAYAFGQGPGVRWNRFNDTEHNVLLAMVDWIERGKPPSYIVGVGDDGEERRHCLHPRKSMWSGTEWVCVSV